MPDFNVCGPFMDFQAKRMLDQDSVEFRPVRSETRSFWEEDPTKITTKTCFEWRTGIGSDFACSDCPYPGSAEIGSVWRGKSCWGVFAWSVLRCRGQLCDAGSGSLLVGW